MRLPKDEPSVFHIYIHLLYTDQIAVQPNAFGVSESKIDTETERLTLAKLYVLAEKLQDVKSKDKTLAGVMGSCYVKPGGKRYPLTAEFVRTIYGGTPTGSMARKLTVDHFVEQGSGAPFKTDDDQEGSTWPVEFLQEPLADVLDRRATLNDTFADGDATPYMEPRDTA